MTQDHSMTRRLLLGSLLAIATTTSFACAQRTTDAPAKAKPSVAAPATKPTTIATTEPTTKRAGFIDEIEKFEASDAKQMPAAGSVLFYGSSTIRLWDTKKSFPELPVLNRGFGGSQMSHALMYADRIAINYQPKVVVLYEGDNDLSSGKAPERVAGEIKQFAEQLHAKVPTAKLVLISTKPSPSRWKFQDKMTELNAMQKAYAAENAAWVTYFDIVPLMLGDNGEPRPELYRADKLHMTEAGYAIWNEAITPVLRKLMAEDVDNRVTSTDH